MLTGIVIKNPDQLQPKLNELATRIKSFWNWTQPLEITYKIHADRRSLSQNSILHALFEDAAQHFRGKGSDVDKDSMKAMLINKFLGTEDIVCGSTVIPGQLKHTSKLDKGEMQQLITEIMDWMFDHSVPVRNPADGEYQILQKRQNA